MRVSSTAQAAEIVNMFFSPLPTRGQIKKAAVRRFNSEKLSLGLWKPIAKSLQLAEYAFISSPRSPLTIKLSLNLNKTITPRQSELISSQMKSIAS